MSAFRFASGSDSNLTGLSLRLAAEQYEKHARELRTGPAPMEALARQFDSQAADARRIADEIEDAE